MSETPAETVGLSDDRVAHLNFCVSALINPSFAVELGEDLKKVRAASELDLLNALVDLNTASAAAELIVEAHTQISDDESGSSLYAYWDIVRSARTNHPGSTLPNSFIGLAEGLAWRYGEDAIALELNDMYTDEVADGDGHEVTQELSPLDKQADDSRLTLDNLVDDSLVHLEDERLVTRHLLDAQKGPESASDRLRLTLRAGSPTMLLTDILGGVFATPEGLAAARMHHDRSILTASAKDPTKLLSLINTNRFTTPDGLAAAKVQQDRIRLSTLEDRPLDLRGDIDANCFTTPEGLVAAKAQHDRDRLGQSEGNPDDLLATIRSEQFYTPVGLEAACEQQDGERLDLHSSDQAALQADVNTFSFLTDEGREAALTILGNASYPL